MRKGNHFSLALVTGATSGIGRALCLLLAEQGIDLIITGRDARRLEELKEQLQSKVQVRTLVADLALKEERQKLIEQIHQLAPDLVFNNAGFGLYGECLTYPTLEQMQILEVDGSALLELTLEAARSLFSQGKSGIIFNVSSAAAFHVMPGLAVYAATKAFVNHFSLAFDKEMSPHGIRILTLCPGMVNTQFQERAGSTQEKQNAGMMTPEFVAQAIWDQVLAQTSLTIIDWKYRLMTFLSYFLPHDLVCYLLKKNILNRIPKRTYIKTKI